MGATLSSQESIHLHNLSCAPLFKGLGAQHLTMLARASHMRHFKPGKFVFLQGDTAESAYVVCHGWIVISLNSLDGRELAINEMRNGDLFGENALIGHTTRSASAIAHHTSEVLEIPRPAFMAVLDSEPLLVRRLLEISIARLAAANDREHALAFLNAPARVARVLREMDEMDRNAADKGYITLSQEELALRTGLTRQTVARFLGQWRRKGWLLTGRERVMLLKRNDLLAVEEFERF